MNAGSTPAIAFLIEQGEIWRNAMQQGRQYLDWNEWGQWVNLAQQHGLVTPEDLDSAHPRMAEVADASMLAYRVFDGTFVKALVIEKIRQIVDAQSKNLSPWHFHMENERRCTIDEEFVARRRLANDLEAKQRREGEEAAKEENARARRRSRRSES